jgi:nucleoside-diphosphate-sugar epimerase
MVPPKTEAELDDLLSTPTPALVRDLAAIPGDIVILGAGGKMGPSLARLARRAADEADGSRAGRRVIAISRFSTPGLPRQLHEAGVETLACDLLDPQAVQELPNAPNVIFMAGRKFGSTGGESLTWAMNTYVPALVAGRYRDARIVVFSSGNVYPLVPVLSGGADEWTPPAPVGEYAQSVLGRERVFEYFSRQYGTPAVLLRLNYAIDLRYGVLLDVAQQVQAGQPVDLTMGHANVIWQGDANAVAIRSLRIATSPPVPLNVTGPEVVSIRWLAQRFGALLGVEPRFCGGEAPTALLSNAARCHQLFGYPSVSLAQMVEWVAHWLRIGGPTLDRPTHFQEREGRF